MSELNPLNDLSRIYLDKVALMNRQEEQNDVERWQGVLDDQMEKSSKELATLGAPTMEEEKKAAKDYDGDGKVESGKDEYFGAKDKAIKKAMKKEELEAVDEGLGIAIKKGARIANRYIKDVTDDDPGRAHTMGSLGNPHLGNEGKKRGVKKEETDNYVEAYVAELNKTTMGSYVKKASKDLSDRRFDQGDSEKRKYDPDAADDKEEKKLVQREKGISRAATKLSKEELELDEAERSIDDRLDRKNKLMKKTTRKAMDFARDEGEASGHARFNMSSLGRESDNLVA